MQPSIYLKSSAAVLAFAAGTLLAQQLERAAISSGGTTAGGGPFEATVTIGEPVVARSSGHGFELHSGFLFPRPGAPGSLIFRDEFEALSPPARAFGPESRESSNHPNRERNNAR